MIECRPVSLFSWTFRLTGGGHAADVEYNWLSEQGRIEADRETFRVVKHGLMGGTWTLQGPDGVRAKAVKSSPLTRTFQIETPSGPATLEAESFVGRAMVLNGSGYGCRIAPAHLFTHRASIEGGFRDFPTVCFAFWLTGLLWKRRNQSSNT